MTDFNTAKGMRNSVPWKFAATLVRPEGVGTWTFAMLPEDLVRSEGLRSHQRLKGTIDGTPFSSSLLPRGGGSVFVVVNSDVRDAIGKKSGDRVRFSLRRDTAPVVVTLPPALARALRADPKAKARFEDLAPSRKRAYVAWVASARRAETLERRVARSVDLLRKGKTL